ncbi:hypothetical protein J2Z21_006196 [Streptomyces griseochromogenes]|uniref:Uncharacterized protein n=1 Tax=Streptomyces griseochromogenes TaxID=68214 RepID=A0A1B1AS66_9ACTN|nr:hypothetical protein [Streptomyces griseochromogenes]ANP49370.1 hypothetical protein AVL59_06975 [Streptomyces griseochromogenes]MBP2053205.1 hypothetical protein [Streptomyces griseochromogenes]
MDSEEHVCPACGQPVETVVGRRKTLGAWVPVWGAGPCRNPGCAAYGEQADPDGTASGPANPHPGESAAEES